MWKYAEILQYRHNQAKADNLPLLTMVLIFQHFAFANAQCDPNNMTVKVHVQ